MRQYLKKKKSILFEYYLTVLMLLLLLPSCSSNKPPEEIFQDNVQKMVLIDRAMGFKEEVSRVSIVDMTVYEEQVEVEVRVEGWATHDDIVIGATLPVSGTRRPGWSIWKFFMVKSGDVWNIREKFKVEEGFGESRT